MLAAWSSGLGRGQRALIAIRYVHRPLITGLVRVIELRITGTCLRSLFVAVDHNRRAALLAANLDDLPQDLFVRDGVFGLAGLALDLHRGTILDVRARVA